MYAASSNVRSTDAGGDTRESHSVSEFDLRNKPESLEYLSQVTNFNKKELRTMYRGFKQECPSGVVNEDTFKLIYSQFFPQGDSNAYAHFVFNAFDKDKNGSISFEEFVRALSMLSRGSVEDKLQWIFTLYDINGDGVITREEFTRIVSSIYNMMGKSSEPVTDEKMVHDHVTRIYQRVCHLSHEALSMQQFSELCQSNEHFLTAIHVFDTQM